jgi:hypothetical protein
MQAPIPSAGQTSEDGQKSLGFIANWIEVIVARLQVHIANINIIFKIPPVVSDDAGKGEKTAKRAHGPSGARGKDAYSQARLRAIASVSHDLRLTLTGLQYFNDDPRSPGGSGGGPGTGTGTGVSAMALSRTMTAAGLGGALGDSGASASASGGVPEGQEGYASTLQVIQLGAKKVRVAINAQDLLGQSCLC